MQRLIAGMNGEEGNLTDLAVDSCLQGSCFISFIPLSHMIHLIQVP